MVKLYFNEEMADVTLNEEQAKEYEALMSKLGIERTHNNSSAESIIPYHLANTAMMNVVKTLCPQQSEYKDYNMTSIPFDVLKAIDFCEDRKFFKKIYIYYNDENPDPFVIGKNYQYYNNTRNTDGTHKYFDTKEECEALPENQNKSYTTNEKYYLIAKWGEENKEWSELEKMAMEKLMIQIGSELNSKIIELEAKKKGLKDNINLFLTGKKTRYDIGI